MNSVFPFDLPGSTTFYLLLFVATLVIHFVFMSYVLAGMVWVVAGLCLPNQTPPERRVPGIVDLLKDWMPLMLSGAITAGVTPLLFIQILYRQQFYTANLLQFHRWMIILPVLIVLFYLLYVVKATGGRTWLKNVAAIVATGCVLFIAWSWTGNHVLSLEHPDVWHARYANSAVGGNSNIVRLRLALWIATTFPVMCGVVMWQMTGRGTADQPPPGVARTAAIAMCGLVMSTVLAVLLFTQLPADVRSELMSSAGLVWIIAGVSGAAVQLAGWITRFRVRKDRLTTRGMVSVGVGLHLTGLMMTRELVRVTTLGDRIDFAGHADAATAEGFTLFTVFCVLNALAAGWCIRLVRV